MRTAVEQLINEFNQELDVAISIVNNDKIKTIKHLINIANKYLEMEKEQICNAYEVGITRGMSYDEDIYHKKNWSSSEQYYNETFKSE
jgi:hypothetical protein